MNILLWVVRQFESYQCSCWLNGTLAASFVVIVDFFINARWLKVASVCLTEEEHFVLFLAQLLISRLIFSELVDDVPSCVGVFDGSIWWWKTKLIQQASKCLNCRHSWSVQGLLPCKLALVCCPTGFVVLIEGFVVQTSESRSRWRCRWT